MEMKAGVGTTKDVFAEWFSDRPKWMQTAAARLATSRQMPPPEAIRALADLSVAEANGVDAVFETMPHGLFGTAVGADAFKLRKLDKVVGVNAIRENACLDFGSADLSVVFGMNGSGKSGYARLLKHACGARHKSDLLPNVFNAAKTGPSCEVTVESGADSNTFEWKAEPDGLAPLRSIHVFDTTAAASYVDSKNLASYEPRRMRFLSSLILICDAVAEELANRKTALPKSFPAVPMEHTLTAAATFVSQLRDTTKPEALEAACAWSAENLEARQDIEKALKQHDVAARSKQLDLDKRRLALFVASYDVLKLAASDEETSKLLKSKREAASKRKAASEDAAKVFAGSALDGIGNASWRLMWDEARKYSEAAAYPGKDFPAIGEGDRCVLCHQPLNDEAKNRLSGFETFVKGGLEASAAKAERDYADAVVGLPSLPERAKWKLDTDFLKVEPAAGEALYDAVSARLAAIPKAEAAETLPPVDWTAVDAAIAAASGAQSKEAATLEELAKDGKKAELEKQLKELKAREWLSQQKAAAEKEICRLAAVRRLEKAEALAKTNALTTKKNELARDELEAGYQERFLAELRALGGTRLKVEPVAVPEGKGKISFKINIRGAVLKASAGSVLSEGESRIVALAAFLADITGSGQPTPFVFDDPVSSLDQEFEERVVERLVELAKTRQVVVFTHRLSLLALVEDAIDARKRAATTVPVLSVITLRSFGGSTGRVDELDVRHKKPKSGFIAIRDHKLPKIRAHEKAGNASEYDSALKTACGDFRILTERSIEKVILDGLMERFRRSIQTKQLKSLTKINANDCALVDSMMTKYSKFEHSQPDELAGVLPTPDELAADLDRVIAWIDEFEKRAA
ncbi:AAA family ATPase [Aromatoleum diolicum]|uniref:AAA family ATPase n=1 Tax=Aromatoleum diolicum TaxID=75796 RepID=A0ABX1QF15_9RHOO|nr:AAA family ATPase [Aromatoleum diolicum]NMG77017.1 AAA family ATPase [Aromatoleum diolicum]